MNANPKLLISLIAVLASLSSSTQAQPHVIDLPSTTTECIHHGSYVTYTKSRITKISAGFPTKSNLTNRRNAVYVTIGNRSVALNNNYNLDSTIGAGILSLLQVAMFINKDVILFDHEEPFCDDFDEIEVLSSNRISLPTLMSGNN